MVDLTCFNINFDSLSWVFLHPKGFIHPSFFSIADRFFEFSDEFGFKHTIFVTGRELKNQKVAKEVS
jgi:hypothetical protein